MKNVAIIDSYLIDGGLSENQILQSAEMLTNPILEKFAINDIIKEVKRFELYY